MHEFYIALSIVETAELEVKKAGGNLVEEIVLEIGDLAGVEEEALEYAWEEAVKQTILEKARCTIEKKSGIARCLNCQQEFTLSFAYDICPSCNGFRKELLQGKEIRIRSLTILYN
ncbi:hydrogenase maturation nickel metallochaperone HypA [Pontibacter saemangeumensis]|uniref:Hydrogenase maturation factor HypA n=1 Tax=Pontibacter saemangeumensis TaxID=1084525 RepID=A0ABP8LW05_9BACT